MSDNNRLQWFLDRISKPIWYLTNGEVVRSVCPTKTDAEWMYYVGQLNGKYFDTKEEAEQFKKSI